MRRPTVGADFLTKKIVVDDVDVVIQIWDTAGQERFHQGTLGSSFYRGAHGALLVYDVNNEKSIEQLAQWRAECLSHIEDETTFPIVVIANKVDLRDKTEESERVDQSVVLSWCKEFMYGHIETSAKENLGVEAAMGAVALLALEAQRSPSVAAIKNRKLNASSSSSASQSTTIRLDRKYERKKDSYCDSCI